MGDSMKNLKVNKIDDKEKYVLNKDAVKFLGKGALAGIGLEAVMNNLVCLHFADEAGYTTIKAANGVINLAFGALGGILVAGIILVRNLIHEDAKKAEEDKKLIKR